ncbi:unnamed protein product (macronuclear) [Paramecium tetraurelia]|uniref:JmjC domain-containing protein n=1 Tax=Paramecium tetraurelia TaxID=5888 RepID=A0D6Z2_PARTE|nr:uncharacterized protein GSPATT00001850001 [Paramecium tetraurelia]CAK78809.1 unnamed protein product [Paramecium tetraurelia]|eukprot:XP_001446206.1 hypothetical protein (macronuclear) [Paramecium tetraurelia strain d4-2]
MLYKNGQIIFEKVKQDGGFIKVYCQKELPQYLIEDNWVDMYKTKIISYEYNQIVNALLIQKPHYCSVTEVLDIWNLDSLAWRTSQVYIISVPSEMTEILTLNFSLPQIKQSHGFTKVEVETNMEGSRKIIQEMQVSQLIEKIQEEQSQNRTPYFTTFNLHKKAKEIKHIKNFLPKSIRPQGKNDVLSYMRNEIPSINIPQFEIRYRCNWRSPSKDQMCFTQVNLNLGPNSCLWITIDKENVAELRQKIIQIEKIDIFNEDKVWFKDADYFLLNNIPFRYFVQNEGDLVVLSPGTFSWQKCEGLCMSCSWNQATLDENSLKTIIDQEKILTELNFISRVPYRNLILDVVIHENSLDQTLLNYLRSELQQFIFEENQNLQSLNQKNAPVFQEKRENLFCTKCKRELFIYFYEEDQNCLCLICLKEHQNINNSNIKQKYRFQCLNFLIGSQLSSCNIEFCSNYTGKTKCTIKVDEQQNYKNKVNKKGLIKPQSENNGKNKILEPLAENAMESSEEENPKRKNKKQDIYKGQKFLKQKKL